MLTLKKKENVDGAAPSPGAGAASGAPGLSGALAKLRSVAPAKKGKSAQEAMRGKMCYAFDFGEYATKIAVGKVNKGRVDIKNLVVVENDERRSAIDKTNLKDWKVRISKALSQKGLNPAGQVALCTISGRSYIGRTLEVPDASNEDLKGLVGNEMAQSLSLDVDTYYFQHKKLNTFEKNGARLCSVWGAGVQKDLCENYYELMEMLRLKPIVLDINSNGIERLLASDPSLKSLADVSVVATVDLGMRGTEVNIYERGRFLHGNTIELGEGQFVQAAKNALGVQIADIHNVNKLVIPPQVVHDIMRQAQVNDNAKAFMDLIEEWISEINTVIQRYNITYSSGNISCLYLYGGSMQLTWLRSYLEKYLNIPTKIMQDSAMYNIPAKVRTESNCVPQFLNAMNLLLAK